MRRKRTPEEARRELRRALGWTLLWGLVFLAAFRLFLYQWGNQ